MASGGLLASMDIKLAAFSKQTGHIYVCLNNTNACSRPTHFFGVRYSTGCNTMESLHTNKLESTNKIVESFNTILK
eukprot:1159126-Pelagomonas_calceolata.AAC.1